MYDPEDELKPPTREDSKLSIDLDQIECWQDEVKNNFDKQVSELEQQMEQEVVAIRNDF